MMWRGRMTVSCQRVEHRERVRAGLFEDEYDATGIGASCGSLASPVASPKWMS